MLKSHEPVNKNSVNGIVVSFNAVNMIAILTLALTVMDSWHAQEKLQGKRLFRELLCDNQNFREYVQWDLAHNGYDFILAESNRAWIDARHVLQGDKKCSDPLWQSVEDVLLTVFPMRKIFVWINLHQAELGPDIYKFQVVERLYAWAMALLLAAVIICILGATTLGLAPPATVGIKTQVPMLFIAMLCLLAGFGCFWEAHHRCIFGQASFRDTSSDIAGQAVFFFFMIPVAGVSLLNSWLTGCYAQKEHGVPIYFSWIPGCHTLYPNAEEEEVVSTAPVNNSRGGGGASPRMSDV